MPSLSEDDFARELVQSHQRVLRFFKRALPHEAEDLASEVLLAAWTAIKDFRGDASVDTLAFRISSRVLWRRRRQLRRTSPLDLGYYGVIRDDEIDGAVAAASLVDERQWSPNIAAAVKIALSKLSPSLARVVELSYLQGKTQRETSEILGLAPGTVASRLRRARDQLRAELAHLAWVDDGDASGVPPENSLRSRTAPPAP